MAAISLTLRRDQVTPKLAALANPELVRRGVLAAATVVASLGQRAFDEPNLRPTSWPARKKAAGGHPLLIKSGTLRQSIFVRPQGKDTALIGTPVIYGAVHQLGFKSIPPRPFFPVLDNQLTGVADAAIGDVLTALIGAAGN